MKDLTKEKILEIIHKNRIKIKNFGVKKLILFGSFARDEQNKDSDIDFLVEFKKNRGLFDDKVGLLILFEKLFNREIDIVKTNCIREELREEILEGVQYAAEI
jgi:hypothetical protein